MQKKELEIMAPAGSFDCLAAAIEGGADSVYFGIGRLNMRSHSANNFSREDLPEIMRICRAYGIKAYMTLNITLYGEDLPAAYETLDAARAAGVDAVIASDMACILYCRKIGLEVHISTQLSISNVEALRFYAQWADVVVLARELNLDQVKAIHEAIAAEHITGPSGNLVRIEMFAHGAFCMAVSGKCYLSLAAYGESANRGACMQVCRRGYRVTDYETGNEIHIDNKINGVIMRETKHRYQLISSHSARRSFATINTLRNIPRSKILRATGHSSEKAFVRYICYDEEN